MNKDQNPFSPIHSDHFYLSFFLKKKISVEILFGVAYLLSYIYYVAELEIGI